MKKIVQAIKNWLKENPRRNLFLLSLGFIPVIAVVIGMAKNRDFFWMANSFLTFLVTWYICGYRIIRETERALLIRMGDPKYRMESGLHHIWWPFEWLFFVPTTLQELNFKPAGIITSAKRYEGSDEESEEDTGGKGEKKKKGRWYGKAVIVVTPAMYYRWPATDKALIRALRALGTTNLKKIQDLFEESVLDGFRTVGGGKTWGEIAMERKKYAKEVRKALLDEKTDPINVAALRDFRLAVKHVELPKELKDSLTKPEIARLEKEAAEAQGEKEKILITKRGEGEAAARRALFDAIGDKTEDLQKETLLTLREMAQGTTTTIFPIPTNVLGVLEEAAGKISGRRGRGSFDPMKFLHSTAGKQFIAEAVKMMGAKP